ncbi:MAG: hypothetical protein ACXWTK_10330 [Methylobacter sp.]
MNIAIKNGAMLGVVLSTGLLAISNANAGATFKIDDTKWISIGAGVRTSFAASEDTAGRPGGEKWSTDFALNNLRFYVNGQVHKYIKFEFNTECANCFEGGGEMRILDGVAKFEYNPYLNLWAGRQLVPEGRIEMNGPFYSATFEPFKTPFEPSDSSIEHFLPGPDAGTFGRDEGVNFWGAALDGHLKYVVGAFEGLNHSSNTANADGNFLYASRVAYQFLEVEKAPGYYTGGTAYGTNGDILTVAGFAQYQEDGAGSFENPGNFLMAGGDVLFEKVLPNKGVLTVNGEYKHFGISNAAEALPACDGTNAPCDTNYFFVGGGAGGATRGFQGNSITGNLLYLIPDKIGIGQLQPYVMYTQVMTQNGPDQGEYEAGMNYIIDGHNARVSLLWQGGDLSGGGGIWNPAANGTFTNAVKLGVQLQI